MLNQQELGTAQRKVWVALANMLLVVPDVKNKQRVTKRTKIWTIRHATPKVRLRGGSVRGSAD